MKYLAFLSILPLMSCQGLLNPDFFKAADDVLTNNTLELSIDKAAFENNHSVHVSIDVEPNPSK